MLSHAVKCPECGRSNWLGSYFCKGCGNGLYKEDYNRELTIYTHTS